VVVLFITIILVCISWYGTYLDSSVAFVPGNTTANMFDNICHLMYCFQEVFRPPFTSCKCVLNPPPVCKYRTHFINLPVKTLSK
jgi:hypothetical protein